MTKKEQVTKSIAAESVLKAKTKKKTVRFISSIIALVLLFGVIMAISAGCKGRKDETDAWVCAQYVVEGHLRSPSTADFCRYNEATITDLGNDRYRIKGYVDAQNAFGGVIRTYFTVTLTLTESGYKDAKCTFN